MHGEVARRVGGASAERCWTEVENSPPRPVGRSAASRAGRNEQPIRRGNTNRQHRRQQCQAVARLQAGLGDPRPAVAFESPFRIHKSLALIAESLPERSLTLTRELTKLHEEVLRGTASEVLAALADRARGEFTLVISGQDRSAGA